MPRCGRLRTFIREFHESPRTEKISFIPPFIIVAIEIILLTHAILSNNPFVIQLTGILVIISVVEIILVIIEIHNHYSLINREKILTIKLDDYITSSHEKNVRIIVENFIEEHPEYKKSRGDIYRTSCQILETHKEETIEREINLKLIKFIKKIDLKNVDDILEKFLNKNKNYKKYRVKVYINICKILAKNEKK